jgi:hypothetical protein
LSPLATLRLNRLIVRGGGVTFCLDQNAHDFVRTRGTIEFWCDLRLVSLPAVMLRCGAGEGGRGEWANKDK